MTITLQIEVTGLVALQQEASDLGVSVEQLATNIVQRHIRARTGPGSVAPDAAFQNAMADTFRRNEELYRRLAK